MDIYICIGSSCHLKGSRSVIEKMEERIRREHLEDRVNIPGIVLYGKLHRWRLCPGRGKDGHRRERGKLR